MVFSLLASFDYVLGMIPDSGKIKMQMVWAKQTKEEELPYTPDERMETNGRRKCGGCPVARATHSI